MRMPRVLASVAGGMRVAAIAVLMVLSQASGAFSASTVYQVVAEPTLEPGSPIPEPTGPVVLRVSGDIAPPAGGRAEVAFDRATLERLGVVRFTTPTSWTEGPTTFDGVLLASVLRAVGAAPDATNLVLTALNDYQALVPAVDATRWPVMLAFRENGRELTLRDRGPLWVIYPQHAYPELGRRQYLSRWVWQLATISVE